MRSIPQVAASVSAVNQTKLAPPYVPTKNPIMPVPNRKARPKNRKARPKDGKARPKDRKERPMDRKARPKHYDAERSMLVMEEPTCLLSFHFLLSSPS